MSDKRIYRTRLSNQVSLAGVRDAVTTLSSNSLHKAMAELGVAPHNISRNFRYRLFFSRLPYYVNTYGFHTIHGRAAAVATGC